MKKVFTYFLISAMTLCHFTSCERDEDVDKEITNNTTSAFFSAKVNSDNFPNAAEKHTKVKFVKSTKTLQILGQPEDQKETIIVTLISLGKVINSAKDWIPGTYTNDPVVSLNAKYSLGGNYNKWNGNGYDEWGGDNNYKGELTELVIQSNDGTKIKGTFKFDAVYTKNGQKDQSNVKKIREGKFDLTIAEQ